MIELRVVEWRQSAGERAVIKGSCLEMDFKLRLGDEIWGSRDGAGGGFFRIEDEAIFFFLISFTIKYGYGDMGLNLRKKKRRDSH